MAVYVFPDSDGETAVDAEGNIWRHMHQEHDGECACYWYWDSPEGRWVIRDLPCAHRDLQLPLHAAEFEDDDGVYWCRPGQDRTFRVPSWNITSLPGHWTHWGRPSIEEQPREFTFDVKFELQERFGHEPQKLAELDEADVEALELGDLLRQYWDLRENMSYHETRLNEPRRSPRYRILLGEITPIQQQLAERGVTPEILDEAERRLSRGEFRVNPKGDSRMYPFGHWTRETLTVGRWVKQNITPVEVGGEAVEELLGW